MKSTGGGEFIKEARKRAGLSQRELAELLATTQAVIARWETGRRSPAFNRVVEAVRACGFDLSVRIVAKDDQHAILVEHSLSVSPLERLNRLAEARSGIDSLSAKVRRKAPSDGV